MESKKSAVLLAFFIALTGLSACHKNPDSGLGGTIGGDKDYLTERYQDTAFDIVVYSRPDSGLIIQNAERMLLGSMQDDVFGRADYHIYAQLVYGGTNASTEGFLPDDVIDSVILILPYSGLYPAQKGAADGRPIRMTVHELTQELYDSGNTDSLYSIDSDIPYTAAFGPAVSFSPRPFDTVYDSVNQWTGVPSLRVPLDVSLGRRLMEFPQSAYDGSGDNILPYFHGLCLRSVPVTTQDESSVVSFAFGTNLTDDGDVMRIVVYHGETATDTARFSLFLFSRVRFTKVERDYSTSMDADFKAQMAGDSTAGGKSVYIASSGGAYMACVLPNVCELFAGRQIIVNRAHLVLKAASAANGSGIDLPATLQIPGSLDDSYSQDGKWNSSDKEYRLVLTRYLQRLLYEQATPVPFYIYPSTVERYGTPKCVKLNGPQAESSPMKLELIYTEVKE